MTKPNSLMIRARFLYVSLLLLVSMLLTGCMNIQTAARFGNNAEVKRQLAWGISPNSQTLNYRVAPLHEAAGSGCTEIIEVLLSKGAEVNIRDEGGGTPLHWAARNNQTEVMKILLTNGADPDQKGTGCGTPMQWAARRGHVKAIETLLNHGVSVNQKGSGGVTALREATSYNHSETVKFLIEHGAVNTDSSD